MRIGVNFDGFKISDYQNRSKPMPPKNYIQDSFRIFWKNGVDLIRIPVYWESYEKDPQGFINELDVVSAEADKYDISCIYDNHQWNCSSCLGFGIGFPNSIVTPTLHDGRLTRSFFRPPLKEDVEQFWNNWWDRAIKTSEGKDGWDVQAEFLKKVIGIVNSRRSTLGFEILNEPQVFRKDDFKKVSDYHDYVIAKAASLTNKLILFCYAYAGSITALNFPWMQAKTRPSFHVKNKIMFDIHPYPPYYVVMLYFKLVSTLMKTGSLFVGEYNAGTSKNVLIGLDQHKRYLKTFKKFYPFGATFWQWSYVEDKAHPAFNLTQILGGKIDSNDNFANLVNALIEMKN
ncbi:MAG: glycoside hydrolase family 5 protein [Thermoproteota archaeon]|nr:glycoside hydrolase family 5 protein [Thermoproteota archaeon]